MSRLGYLAIASAAVLWATGATVASRLFDRGAAPIEVAAARAWIATIGIGVLVLAARWRRARRTSSREGPRRPGLRSVVPFGLSIAAANFLYYFAISRLPVAIAIVIQYTAPGLVVLWTATAARRRPSARVAWALALAFLGVALLAELPQVVARGEARLDAAGILAALGSAMAFAVYMLTGESLGRVFGPDGALLRGFGVAGIFWIAVLGTRGRPDTLLDSSFAPGILFVSIGATIAPFLLFLWGLGHVGASRAAIVATLEPLAAAAFAYLWLDETLGALQVVGAAMVVAGIAVVQSERPAAPEVLAEAAAVE